jgi:CDP-diacylglycerol---glycerol-3-phosphate 3-phosphatidyltransferase
MTPSVQRLLLSTNPEKGTVIAASPWANGFYGSAGISGMLPAAYTHLSKRFLQAVRLKGMADQIQLMEWRHGTINEPGGWTYHAKGIWVTLPREQHPSLSIVGSSNYTKRSYGLDLEANVVLVTRDEGLMKRLGDEEQWLKDYARVVDENEYKKEDRKVSWKVRAAMWTVKVLGGAL